MLNFDGQLVDVWIFGGEPGEGDTEFQRWSSKSAGRCPLYRENAKSNMATDHGVLDQRLHLGEESRRQSGDWIAVSS